jgi:hypothetical protein
MSRIEAGVAAPTIALVRAAFGTSPESSGISVSSGHETTKGPRDAKLMKQAQLSYPSKAIRRLSLLVGYIVSELSSVYAIFVAHTMNPVGYRLVESDIHLKAIYGRYQEIYNWDGLVPTLVIAFVVFALAWCAVQGIARTIAGPALLLDWRKREVRSQRRRYQALSLSAPWKRQNTRRRAAGGCEEVPWNLSGLGRYRCLEQPCS